MKNAATDVEWLSFGILLGFCLMLSGCGGERSDTASQNELASPSSSGAPLTVEAMLDLWEDGDEEAALEALLGMDWSDPPLAEGSLLAVDNQQLARSADVGKAAELAQQAKVQYFDAWQPLGEYANEQLDAAREAGDEAQAERIESSLDAMVEYLQRPEHLGIFQRLGPAIEPLAPGEVQLPAGF